jgi:multidrug resistance efflux pump
MTDLNVGKSKVHGSKTRKLFIIGTVLSALVAILLFFGALWYIDQIRFITTEDARFWSDNVSVSSKISGRVKALLVKQCDQVAKDQVIAELDRSEIEVALNQAKANLDMANVRQKQAQEALSLQMLSTSSQIKQAYNGLQIAKEKLAEAQKGSRPEEVSIAEEKVNQSKIALDTAKDTLSRNATLYQEGAISEYQYKQYTDSVTLAEKNYNQALDSYSLTKQGIRPEEKSMLEKQVAQAQSSFDLSAGGDRQSRIKMYDLQAAEIAVKQASLALDLATINYNNASIKSPCNGVIGLKSINEGETVSPGQSLFSVINLDKIWVSSNIKETQIGKVKTGSKVQITVDALEGKKFEGEVYEIGNATNSTFSLLPSFNTSGNFTKVTQLIPIKVKVLGDTKNFKVGSSVKIKIGI